MRGLATHYSNIFGLVVDRNSTCRRRILSATILPPQKGHWEKGADEPSLKQGSSGWIPTRWKGKLTVLFVLLTVGGGFAAGGGGRLGGLPCGRGNRFQPVD